MSKHVIRMGVIGETAADELAPAILSAIQRWLNKIYPFEGEDLIYSLGIVKSKPAHGFSGVCIRTSINGRRPSLELRVSLKGWTEQWVCLLYPPEESLLSEIFMAARPGAYAFLHSKLKADDKLASIGRNASERGGKKVEKIFKMQDKTVDKLRGPKLAELAFTLHCKISKKQEGIDLDDIFSAVISVLGNKIRREVLPHVMELLVAEAVLDPTIAKSKVLFLSGIYMNDLLDIRKDLLDVAEAERLGREIAACDKSLSEQNKLRKAAAERLAAIDNTIAEINDKKRAKVARLEELLNKDD